MPHVQVVFVKADAVLLVNHRQDGHEWWCLPGGALEPGEIPEKGALRELREECEVDGVSLRQTSHVCFGLGDETYSFLVDIADQTPTLGANADVAPGREVLSVGQWLRLRDLPERARTYLWAAGLLGTGSLRSEVQSWGDDTSSPGDEHSNKSASDDAQ